MKIGDTQFALKGNGKIIKSKIQSIDGGELVPEVPAVPAYNTPIIVTLEKDGENISAENVKDTFEEIKAIKVAEVEAEKAIEEAEIATKEEVITAKDAEIVELNKETEDSVEDYTEEEEAEL